MMKPSLFVCVGCSPEFRFSDHIEHAVPPDDDQPKKMLLKRDADSCEVSDEHFVCDRVQQWIDKISGHSARQVMC